MGGCCSLPRLGLRPAGHRASNHDHRRDADTGAEAAPRSLEGCVFCQIAAGHKEQQKVVFQTERLVVFRDRSPAATAHLQVVPRHHIDNLNALQPSSQDHELVAEMIETGRRVLEQLHPGSPQWLGFHKPPFNSVLHLHLHAIALPWLPDAPHWKYWKHAPWWLPAERALQRLEPTPGSSNSSKRSHAGGAAAATGGTAAAAAEEKRLL
ncbi:histidine triad nucleotide-binding 3 [Chlorella sorokiniana]|uniref:Histidine triad nucleotide-binding 3 n=1 Tax=Chlorella sorokiniana TaxID=3076 RepID=A0A2P6TVR2_CHLSO|nr:histidine triad nucleotide-binding 3 [Chlorella sorokiniana]|eukprot:PRW58146.1 histidine triad nucleotide-binding 3 [Chlorella sorokiniana]